MKQREKEFKLVIPLDATGIQDFDPKQPLKVMVMSREGIRQVQTVTLSAKGVGEAEFAFDEHPGDVQVLVGPASASGDELEGMQTLRMEIPARHWRDEPVLKARPLLISPYFWHWWLHWCRTFTIRGRVVCPDGNPVPGAKVCARDVDRFFIWTSTQEIGCATTDANGAFEISFRWCCGWWPWWWWRHRFWEIDPVLWAKIQEWLHEIGEVEHVHIPGPRPDPAWLEKLLELHADVKPGPRPPVERLQPGPMAPMAMMTAETAPAPQKAMLDPARLEQLRPELAKRLPHLAEISDMKLYPWYPWLPWWDCNPDVIFKVTQIQGGEEVVLVDETPADTRWNIGVDTNVILVASDEAWCIKPEPSCAEGNCLSFSTVCGDPVSAIGGNFGAAASPRGYLHPGRIDKHGDRPYADVITIHGTASCLTDVDFYKFQWSDDGGSTWNDMPPDAIGAVVRGYIDFKNQEYPKIVFPAQHIDGQDVLETIAHYEATHVIPNGGVWGYDGIWAYNRDRLFVWKTLKHHPHDSPPPTPLFPDGEYLLRMVGYNLAGTQLVDERVLTICEEQAPAHLVLRLDNRLVTTGPNDAYGNRCGSGAIHTCTDEPSTAILATRILHANGTITPIDACKIVEVGQDDQFQVDFMAYDPDGHLAYFTLDLTYGDNSVVRLMEDANLTAPGVSLVPLSGGPAPAAAQVGPTYHKALGQGAVSPIWRGGVMRLTMPAHRAFHDTCSYQLELRAYKRTIVNCNHSFWPHSNLSERSFVVKTV